MKKKGEKRRKKQQPIPGFELERFDFVDLYLNIHLDIFKTFFGMENLNYFFSPTRDATYRGKI